MAFCLEECRGFLLLREEEDCRVRCHLERAVEQGERLVCERAGVGWGVGLVVGGAVLFGWRCERRGHARGPESEERRQHEQKIRVRVVLGGERAQPLVRGGQILLGERVDLGVERRRLCFGEFVAPVKELIQCEREVCGDARQKAHVRQALPELPFGHGCLRDAEMLCQGFLGYAGTAPLSRDGASDVDRFAHGCPFFAVNGWMPAFASSMESNSGGIKGAAVDFERDWSTGTRRPRRDRSKDVGGRGGAYVAAVADLDLRRPSLRNRLELPQDLLDVRPPDLLERFLERESLDQTELHVGDRLAVA